MARTTDTRFLVITHHPMTMSRMNRLFGVTMQEKGISQLRMPFQDRALSEPLPFNERDRQYTVS